MKTFLISGVSALALAGMALAVPFEEADTDGDGRISLEELQAVDANTTEAEFTLYDIDLDGGLDEDEYAAWRAATQQDAAPDPVLDEPEFDEPMTQDEPVDLEEVPADPYAPSLEKSFQEAEEDKDEYARDEDQDDPFAVDEGFAQDEGYEPSDFALDRDDVSDPDAHEDEITDDLNEQEAERLDDEAAEDGDEEEPWK